MMFSFLLEAALRSFLLALAVWIGLRVFRVRNVLAQKAAWGVVLAAALLTPIVLPMASHWNVLPANVRVVIPADPETLLEELQARIQATPASSDAKPAVVANPAGEGALSDQAAADRPAVGPSEDVAATPMVASNSSATDEDANIQPQPAPHYASVPIISTPGAQVSLDRDKTSILTKVLLLYLGVAAVLLGRLIWGMIAAFRLRQTAKPIFVDPRIFQAANLDLRASPRVASPVTIGSSIVLPPSYKTWESEKLRVVLAHERSHVRQGDFYLQLLAGIYASAVWFSPLGWWLKGKLSDLAEAISDRAGLEEAADRTTYAQVLLEFAAAPRPTLIGVAMARTGSLSRRIERLLNDVSFRQAFSGSRRSVAAVLVIPIALFCASALVHVQAAGQAPAAPPSPSAPPSPAAAPAAPGVVAPQAPAAADAITGVATPEAISTDDPTPPALAPAPAVQAIAPQLAPVPPAPAAPAEPAVLAITPMAAPPGQLVLVAPKAPRGMDKVMILPSPASGVSGPTMAIIAPGASYSYGTGYGAGTGQSTTTENGNISQDGKRSGYRYHYSSDGDSYAIVRGDGSGQMSFNGDIHTSDIDRVRKQAHGDFLWFTHDGKSYFIDDPATLSQIEAMYKPMEDLGHQQEELGKKQEALGKQQEELGREQESASVRTPDMSKEIGKIEEATAKLKASEGKNMTQDEFADLQEKLAELQSRLGEMQSRIGAKQGEFGEKMGELGARMGELGAQQGRLGSEQGRIAQENDRKVKSIIDEGLKSGKAHPVQ